MFRWFNLLWIWAGTSLIHEAVWSVWWEDHGIESWIGFLFSKGLYETCGFSGEQTSSVKNLSGEEVEDVLEPLIVHKWFSADDLRQKYVQYAYKLGGMDFVTMIECEAWSWSIHARWDNWHARGLCQLNDRWHYVSEAYKTTWQVQIEACYKKWKWGTKFYWPSRKINGQRCSSYVLNRFVING